MARSKQPSTQLAFDLWDLPFQEVTPPVAREHTLVAPTPVIPAVEVSQPPLERPAVEVLPRPSTRTAGRNADTRVVDAVAAARVVQELRESGTPATASQREVLALWPGWGATPDLFDDAKKKYAAERAELQELWSPEEWAAARRTTINAHYTDPAYVEAVWAALHTLGFTGGRVLEPGCGSGNFIGAAPAGTELVGVELDPITAEISRHLFPHAQIRCESFAVTTLDGDGYDAVIGNVPFSSVALLDRAYNPEKFSLHNHFIDKSLAFTKPGGLVALLTSRYTMDAKNSRVREHLFESADLVGAVRLPAGAHKNTAGTDVVTDLLVLRKRTYGQAPGDDSWLRTESMQFGEGKTDVNSYFVQNPSMMVGTLGFGRGLYGVPALTVTHPKALVVPDVQSTIARLAESAAASGVVWAASGQRVEYRPTEVRTPDGAALVIGHLSVEDGEVWAEALTGRTVVDAPVLTKTELVALLELRDTAVELLEAESTPASTPEMLATLRADLNERYDSYRSQFGAINRVELVSIRGRTADEDGAAAHRRKYPPAVQLFRQDPHAATVMALEIFDEESQKAAKADIFQRRIVGSPPPAPQVAGAADALAVVLDGGGQINVDAVAELLNTTPEDALAQLIGQQLVFTEPAENGDAVPVLVPRAEYLSGNVRRKLKDALRAVESDPAYAVNVEALEAVLPASFGPAEIDVRIGATWVPTRDYVDYIQSRTSNANVKLDRAGGGKWQLQIGRIPEYLSREIGTPDMGAQTMFLRVMNHGKLVIERTDDDGKKWVDTEATELLREKANLLVEDFQQWLWADPDRAARASEIYNDRFNATVLRSYDDVALSLPGKAEGFTPRPHQVAAVARMINEPAAGLFHEVGAGKTAEMVMGVMELRRLGMVSKPAIVVPNHMLDQFTREFKQVYPLARVLSAGSDDLSKSAGRDGRRVFVARARTGNWDAVIITRSAFTRLGLSPDTEAGFLRGKIDIERGRLQALNDSSLGRSRVKGQEKAIMALEEKLKAAMDMPRDDGLYFEKTGIDYLCVDEAHGYKNLQVTSSYEGLAKPVGSNLAMDLDMKLQYLRSVGGKRVVTLATATPMANGLQELYVMQSYLRPDLLEDAGLVNADEWARQFTEEVTQVEVGPAGDYRMKTRIGKFRNLPELLTMFHVAGDVKTAKDLGLPVPKLVPRPDGRRSPEVVVIPVTVRAKEFQASIGERAIAIRSGVDPAVDNMLKLSNDARQAALDMRLYDASWQPGEGDDTKATVAAARIMQIHKRFQNTVFVDSMGEEHPTPGGVQLVFADRGTPSPDRFSVYYELKEKLVGLGMPASKIRFIHEAATDSEKDAIFAACRNGSVSVLVGSTEKMGTGMNIQARATALHHLDCPWRPADVVQREGRVVRQLNQNDEVEVLRYVQAGSFDAFMWQTVTRKAVAAEQIMSGRVSGRELEMLSDEVFSFAEAMAMSNDDPRIVERIELDSEIQRLKRLERGHQREKIALRGRVRDFAHQAKSLQEGIPTFDHLLAQRIDTAGDNFTGYSISDTYSTPVNPPQIRVRADFGNTLKHQIVAATRTPPSEPGEMTRIHGLHIGVGGVAFSPSHFINISSGVHTARFQLIDPKFAYRMLEEDVRIPVGELLEMAPHALAIRLENKVAGLTEYRAGLDQRVADALQETEKLTEQLERPFTRRQELSNLEDRRSQLIAAMTTPDAVTTNAIPKATPPTLAAPDPDLGPTLCK